MSYKKYVKKGGKSFGPYYYESFRDKSGKVKRRYLGTEDPNEQKSIVHTEKSIKFLPIFLILFIVILLILGAGFFIVKIQKSFTGFSISDTMTESQKQSVLLENENVLQTVNSGDSSLSIKDPVKVSGQVINKNKNKRLDFQTKDGKIRLYFDLLNYSEFVENVAVESNMSVFINETINELILNETNFTLENSSNVTIPQLNESLNITIPENESNIAIPNENITLPVNDSENENNSNLTGNSSNNQENPTQDINNSVTSPESQNDSLDLEKPLDNPENKNSQTPVNIEQTQNNPEQNSQPNEQNPDSQNQDNQPSSETSDTESEQSSETNPIFGFFLGLIGRNLVTGHAVLDINSTEVSVDLNSVQNKVEELNNLDNSKVNEIADNSKVEANDFSIEAIANKTKKQDNYKWGYKIRLDDLKFLAKVDVTSEEKISIYDDNTLKIGRNLLSFKDLSDSGYNIRFEIPPLEIPINVIVQVVENKIENNPILNESLNDSEQTPTIIGITGNSVKLSSNKNLFSKIINSIGKFTGFAVSDDSLSEVDDVKYSNSITVYIEKDFTDNSEGIKVGDIINLDPELIIIPASDAEHLDSSRNYLENVFDYIKTVDNNYTTIPQNDYLRVYFIQSLDKTKDITIYAKTSGNNSVIIDGKEVPYDIYLKMKRIDELKRSLNES